MVEMMIKNSILVFTFFLLTSCQTNPSQNNELVEGNFELKRSDGILDLSQFSQEQQKIEREQAAKRREELKAGRVILEHDKKEEVAASTVNLAVFARSASNKIGERVYNRNFAQAQNKGACSKFPNANKAQIFFLKNGGPRYDYYNIDEDGDGFACKWDPTIYRKINSMPEIEEKSIVEDVSE